MAFLMNNQTHFLNFESFFPSGMNIPMYAHFNI